MKSSPTTQLVSRIVLSGGRTLDYEYDAEERITKVIDSVDGVTEYTYDAMGQLLTESVDGVVVNTMTYDNYGNILTKNGVSYEYDSTWKDLLTKVGNDTITYDAQGNPTSYLGHTLTWEKGRQLKSFDSNTYTYNANGIRTSKTIDGVTHTYMLDGSKILRETWGSNTLVPLYDNEDNVCGILYNSTPYYFQKNLQGDIIAIVDANADVVARYTYDAWGVCTITQDTSTVGIASINPYRYRGYYFDSEIGMYYLQSRYYNPVVGRFINADDPTIINSQSTIGACLLYVYCYNNPVQSFDVCGCSPIQAVFAVIGAIAGWFLGDYVARRLGYYPNRGSFWSRATYWTIRAGVVIGGAIIGWFAASALTIIIKGFIFSSPKLIASTPLWIYRFLGIATGTGSVVLGKYPLYVQLAEKLGSSIFEIAVKIWNSMSGAEQWNANKAFLDKIIQSGQKITLQTNAYSSKVTGYFAKEIEYLLQHGYKIIQGGWGMGPK